MTDTCSSSGVCVNTNGSYLCHCANGYSGDGYNCTGKCQFHCLLAIRVMT